MKTDNLNVPKLRFPEFLEAGEWVEKSLGKVAEIVTGNTPSTADLNNYGGNRLFVSPVDISDNRYITKTKTTLTEAGFKKTRLVKANSILFVCIGSTIGKIAQNSFDCATNQQINSVIPSAEYSDNFIYSVLEFNAKKIASIAGNHAVPIINKTTFSNIIISFPLLPEQQKIAACLSSLDELISAHSKKLDALKKHKKGLMQQLFPAEGQTVPSLRFPEFSEAGEWIRKSGDEITIKITKGSSPNWQGFNYQNQGVLFITSENVRDGYLDVSNPKYLSEKFYDKQKNSQLSYGDILVNIVGASIGRSCLYLLEHKAFINQAVAIFRVNRDISFNFISYYYQNNEILKKMFEIQSDSARPNLSLTDLNNIEFYVPTLPEQQKIAACLSSLDELITAQSQKLDALKKHKKGLMQQLFPVAGAE